MIADAPAAGFKVCTGCDEAKPLTAFRRYPGSAIPRARCKACGVREAIRRRHVRAFGATPYGWGPLDDARLMTLAVLRIPVKEAAFIVGRSLSNVRQRLKVLAAATPEPLASALRDAGTPPIWTPDRLARLERLLTDTGISRSQAAAKLGVTKGAVSGAVHRHLPHLMHAKPSSLTSESVLS